MVGLGKRIPNQHETLGTLQCVSRPPPDLSSDIGSLKRCPLRAAGGTMNTSWLGST